MKLYQNLRLLKTQMIDLELPMESVMASEAWPDRY
jgi:hypothetical protein